MGTKIKLDSEEKEDGNTCPICLETFTNFGNHRLVSIDCGHLFGKKCIERWIRECVGQQFCPQCKGHANWGDIRPLYTNNVVVMDVFEKDSLKEKLKEMASANSSLNAELEEAKNGRKQLEEQLKILKNGDSKLNSPRYSADYFSSGYGIWKLNTKDFRPLQCGFLHQNPIQDMKFQPRENLLLTASLDRCAKLLDMTSNTVAQTYNADVPLLSCCWNEQNSNNFFVGGEKGQVLEYDIRRNILLNKLEEFIDNSPVVSLASFSPKTFGSHRGGIFACRHNSCWSYELHNNYLPEVLPIQGPFFSLSFSDPTDYLLVSSRPRESLSSTQNMLYRVCQSKDKKRNCKVYTPVTTFFDERLKALPSLQTVNTLQGVPVYDENFFNISHIPIVQPTLISFQGDINSIRDYTVHIHNHVTVPFNEIVRDFVQSKASKENYLQQEATAKQSADQQVKARMQERVGEEAEKEKRWRRRRGGGLLIRLQGRVRVRALE
uniref:RING-type E3 ubiquitin transferase n=1 Tax=Timema californicum TaxID=61474 RepID=A0A7R9PCV1_TIMCA|nr:unnamed protein product [Timema californicum]